VDEANLAEKEITYQYQETPELKEELKENTTKFLITMTNQLNESLLLEEDQPKNMVESYGLLGAVLNFESAHLGVILDEGGKALPKEKLGRIQRFYEETIEELIVSVGKLAQTEEKEPDAKPEHFIEKALEALPKAEDNRMTLELNRYKKIVTDPRRARRPETPFRENSLSFWRAFQEGKFENPQRIIDRHINK